MAPFENTLVQPQEGSNKPSEGKPGVEGGGTKGAVEKASKLLNKANDDPNTKQELLTALAQNPFLVVELIAQDFKNINKLAQLIGITELVRILAQIDPKLLKNLLPSLESNPLLDTNGNPVTLVSLANMMAQILGESTAQARAAIAETVKGFPSSREDGAERTKEVQLVEISLEYLQTLITKASEIARARLKQ